MTFKKLYIILPGEIREKMDHTENQRRFILYINVRKFE